MTFLTTTALEVDEELLNRCLVFTVDELTAQTQAIHDLQRQSRTLEGVLSLAVRSDLIQKHKNAQRLLEKYLTLIDAVALLHQHQRATKEAKRGPATIRYIEVTHRDVEIANWLAAPLLGRTLDELEPQTRGVLRGIIDLVTSQGILPSEYRFTRRTLRERLDVSDTRLRAHLDRRVELEYLLVHRGHRGRSFVYELVYTPETPGGPHVPGLLDASEPASSSSSPSGASSAPRNGHARAGGWSTSAVKPLPN